jgi:hypothetical protein
LLVTLDLDFSNPLVFPPASAAGIAMLRIPSRPTDDVLADARRALIVALSIQDASGRLRVVPRGRVREHLPRPSDQPDQ